MRDILDAVSASFGSANLTSLSLDDYAVAEPCDLHRLATSFSSLKTLSLGDRFIWKGSRVRFFLAPSPSFVNLYLLPQADFLNALIPLASLHTLSCRIFPESPATTFRLAFSPAEEEGEEEEYASPASIAIEAASLLPKLSLVGFSGRQSSEEWFKVRRDGEGRPEEAEGVELYSLDLDFYRS
jgi:hypothetical protein